MVRYVFILAILVLSHSAFASVPIPSLKPTAMGKVTEKKHEEGFIPQPIILNVEKDHYKPLSHHDAEMYKTVFDLQQDEKWSEADQFIEKIDNPVLLGHVLAQRYLNESYAPSFEQLKNWTAEYSDHPQSRFINARQSNYESRIVGTTAELRYFANGSKYISRKYTKSQRYELGLVKKKIGEYLGRGAVSAALSYFNNHRTQSYIDDVEKAQILSKIAAHYMYLKKLKKARSTALKALRLSDQAPLAGWVAGVTAWMDDDFAEATKYFTIASNAEYASPWTVAAASYWGARAATRAGLNREVVPLLARAIENQRTFYGLIAMKAMEKAIGSMPFDFDWDIPTFQPDHKDTLMMHPAGARALALVDVGRYTSAQGELYALPVKNDPRMANAAIALANHYNLAGYAMRFSSVIKKENGGFYDSGLYPVSAWTTNVKGYDKALLNAFIRQESRFQPMARNNTGARGLMQVMPGTAAFITGDEEFKTPDGQRLLDYPKINVEIGANYLKHLRELEAVNHDLFSLAIAYNAGPGKLRRWKNELKIDDPLLFIELIPSSETRAFVERVVTNYWIYQIHMGIKPNTLLDVAQGQWPIIKKDN